jgi:hypothetical protein
MIEFVLKTIWRHIKSAHGKLENDGAFTPVLYFPWLKHKTPLFHYSKATQIWAHIFKLLKGCFQIS